MRSRVLARPCRLKHSNPFAGIGAAQFLAFATDVRVSPAKVSQKQVDALFAKSSGTHRRTEKHELMPQVNTARAVPVQMWQG